MHYIFIGNGIISLSTAFRLLENLSSSSKITIIGAKERVGSATLAAAAMLNSFCEVDEDTFSNKYNKLRFEMSIKATDLWPAFIKKYSQLKDIQKTKHPNPILDGGLGTYLINNTSADSYDDENYNLIIKALKKYDQPYQPVEPQDIPGYYPNQKDRTNHAIFIRNEGWINPNSTINSLEQYLGNDGRVDFVNENVKFLNQRNNKLDHLTLVSGKKISGDKFLLASGSNVTDLLRDSKIDITIPRIFYGVGVSVLISNPKEYLSNCIRTPNRGLACGIYASPFMSRDSTNKVVAGATNLISPRPIFKPRIVEVQSLLENVKNQINLKMYNSELEKINIGWRPTSADTYPLIGPTSVEGLYIASGTKRDGFHQAPLLSKILSSMLSGEKVDKKYKWFHPERNHIRTLTREQAIKKSVKHLMSASYQHGFSPGLYTTENKLRNKYKDDLEKLHDDVGAINWGIPTDMLEMYRYNQIKY
ncbi:MAG: FAD-dependent oxidoreductase [Candidatus Marinimicrobia bacterium]|nr:FAD-dependent oxidoreductase [Candidatus Neomarinimicrobiota bacterium]